MKKFEMAEIQVEKIEVVDVITTSTCGVHIECPDDYCPNATDWA